MNLSALKTLLDKYYEGRTSAEEEKELVNLLGQDDLPGEYYEDRLMIAGLAGKDGIPEPAAGMEKRIMKFIDDSEEKRSITRKRHRLYAAVSVAASILIIISFWFIFDANRALRDSYSDPQMAYNEAVEALYIVSSNLNKGREQMEGLSMLARTESRIKLLPESREVVSKELEPLRYLGNSLQLMGLNE